MSAERHDDAEHDEGDRGGHSDREDERGVEIGMREGFDGRWPGSRLAARTFVVTHCAIVADEPPARRTAAPAGVPGAMRQAHGADATIGPRAYAERMSVRSILRGAVGAALLVNAVPHGVRGVQGEQFPTPFADPPGVGLSSPTVNVGWSAANAVLGALLLRRGTRSRGEIAAAAIGAIGMAAIISYHFGDVMRGGRGLRGLRDRSNCEPGPPRAIVMTRTPSDAKPE